MTNAGRRCIVCAALAWLPGAALPQVQTDLLKHDPFARPAPAVRPAAAALQAPVAAPDWKPELSAIMLAGANSIVSVEGTFVSLGGQVNGYRLVEVFETSAIFVNGNRRVRLALRGEPKMGEKK
jgi:hypothetical protein